MLQDVLVTGSQIRPVIRPQLQGFFRVLLIGGSNRSFDVHSPAQMRHDAVVVGDLGLGPVSDRRLLLWSTATKRMSWMTALRVVRERSVQ